VTTAESPRIDPEALLAIVAGLVPATAEQVGSALGKLSVRLEELTNQLTAADEEATKLDHELQLAYDLAYLEAGEVEERVTGPVREATARVATADLRLRTEVAKLRVRSLKAAHRTLDRRIDVGRTQAATVRSEHRTVGYGGGA
jgi:chaperonin cofactor prefoldin